MFFLKKLDSKKITPYLFLAPPLSIYVGLVIFPICFSVYKSFFWWHGLSNKSVFVGFGNYVKLFHSARLYTAVSNNLTWIICFLIFPLLLGFFLALLLQENRREVTLYRSIFYFPMVISFAVIALIWSSVYEPKTGILNETLRLLRLGFLARGWLSDPKLALYAVIAAGCWQHTGFAMIIYLAALKGVPLDLIDSARIDGASYSQILWYVIIPLLRHATIVILAITVINSLRVFDMVYIMTRGGPGGATEVLSVFMWREAFYTHRMGYGVTIGVIIFLLALVTIVPYVKYSLHKEVEL